jgi:hypothetical protein
LALVVQEARQEPRLQTRRPVGQSLSALQCCSPQERNPKNPVWQVSTLEQVADVVQN